MSEGEIFAMLRDAEKWLEGGKQGDMQMALASRASPTVNEVADLMRQYASEKDAPTADEMREAVRQFRDTEKGYGGMAAWEKAKADGKTKLGYRQWVQVRTPNFKQWWGYNWEHGGDNGAYKTQAMVGREGGEAEKGNSGGTDAGFVRGRQDSGGATELHHGIASGFPFVYPETGEPNIFFHGTRDKFTEFDVNHPNKKDAGWLGRGHYVTNDIRWKGSRKGATRQQKTTMVDPHRRD